ncbi:hypothetical protein [Wenzhouxiangella sediminis]|uniref:hypothetical protein n=1 Tax=Wenzhouxiangella sediminis TaxID=1792836 RepID=UPI0015F28892|nr:hypothetical protein [Wenzhouxiangella sediminis]
MDEDSGALTRPFFGALVFWFFGFFGSGSFGLAGRLRREECGVWGRCPGKGSRQGAKAQSSQRIKEDKTDEIQTDIDALINSSFFLIFTLATFAPWRLGVRPFQSTSPPPTPTRSQRLLRARQYLGFLE